MAAMLKICLLAAILPLTLSAAPGLPSDDSAQIAAFSVWLHRVEDSLQKSSFDTLCILKRPLTKARPEGSLGNWISDLVRGHLGKQADACIFSFGLADTSYWPPGAFLRKDVYRLLHNDDELLRLELSGKQLQELCDSIAASGGIPVSGIRMNIRDRRARKIFVGSKELYSGLIYRIAVNRRLLRDPHIPGNLYRYRYAPAMNASLRRILLDALESGRQQGQVPDPVPDKRICYEY